ncbi:CAF17-like 4Fe-4S cluster assembly/insertion protein YgfZ [Amantichitinum ursilacus]|uniref:tRNA-modifying protein YgfZ n=1 Tax=Amantichitinum ursilacus TaxID=857265 RepID=A0A0N0GME0_9NEIS|nr:folate-binding protein YgfZ [Amantichitinum ursilacus]KPC50827.1 tRNA-modifying protein YgfZ [Amantichitinum ursilacus]
MSWTDTVTVAPSPADTALAALDTGCVISPLTQFGVMRFSGEETMTFLQGQLSSDLSKVDDASAQYSSYSTPKGRMLASFLIYRAQGDFLVQISSDLQPAIQKRLSMFILRSKTKASDATAELALIGVAGPHAGALVAQVTGAALPEALKVADWDMGAIVGLPGERYQLVVSAEQAAGVWQALASAGAVSVNADVWRLTEVRAGTPWITAATQEEFVPQMANMELIGAVSFSKGCYPGQEIVARTQYLGKLKRRMYRVQVPATAVAGQEVFSPEMNGQPSGRIMLAAPAAAGQSEALVVVQMSSLEHGLHLGAPDGPALQVLDLPYAIG